MATRDRREHPGATHHLYACGVDGRAIFVAPDDPNIYLGLLAKTVDRYEWQVVSYCLMTNHVHLIVRTPEPTLSRGVHLLHGRYSKIFNRRHNREGHLFQQRFGSTLIEDDAQLCMTIRYVALNPVEAGLCERPEDWALSSCAGCLSGDTPPWLDVDRLMGSFDWLGGDPREHYRALVEP